MVRVELGRGRLLMEVVEAIKGMVESAYFDFSPTQMSLNAIDSNGVIVNLVLRSNNFNSYECPFEQTMGIDLDRMYNVFQLCGHDDSLTLESVRDYAVKLIFTSPDRDTIATIELNLVSDFLWTDFVIKDTEPYAVVRMPSSGLESMCKMLIVASDTIIISVTKEQVKFSIICDTGAIDYTFVQRTVPADKPEDETVIQMHETMEPVSMMVDLEYLKVFTKATLLSKTVTLKFCPDDNLVVVYQIPRFGFLKFCMPKE
ncbi:hypothetical protein MIMGU_mgv1a020187mg [Erythranthe guttata]|uniref:DNA sliding clamp PCNA n=2 Tax=Erythranthe guttata TaxID=4155 RepID=A0A022QWY9_ERYGU|nr:hypothetical protein MIMGU_mgv1a020187mg [Erythranthe guttata]